MPEITGRQNETAWRLYSTATVLSVIACSGMLWRATEQASRCSRSQQHSTVGASNQMQQLHAQRCPYYDKPNALCYFAQYYIHLTTAFNKLETGIQAQNSCANMPVRPRNTVQQCANMSGTRLAQMVHSRHTGNRQRARQGQCCWNKQMLGENTQLLLSQQATVCTYGRSQVRSVKLSNAEY